MRAFRLACGLLALLISAGIGAAQGPPRVRPLMLGRSVAERARVFQPQLSPADVPSGFRQRDFPGLLRSGTLPNQPDGLLWRRLRRDHPAVDPMRLLRNPLGLSLMDARPAEPITLRVLALRVDFLADGAGAGTTADGRFDLRHPDSARVAIDPPPHNGAYFDAHLRALERYYAKQSGGWLQLDWDIFPAETDSVFHLGDTADYGPWDLTGDDDRVLALAEKFVRDAFAVADTSAAPPDFRDYDGFVVFHAGPDLQGDINRDSPYDIPSFNIQLAEPVAVQDSTFFIDLIMVMPEFVTQDGYLGALNGVMTHEFGHQLGFFDLYNVLNFFPQVGMFSLMDSGDNLFGTVWDPYAEVETFVRGAIPASIDPWHKLTSPFFRNGMDAIFVADDWEGALKAVQTGRELAVVPLGGERGYDSEGNEYLDFSEYFILENRSYDLNDDGAVYLQADSTTGVILGPMNIPKDVCDSLGIPEDTLGEYEQDYLLPGGGILVWHVDNQALSAAFDYHYGGVNVLPGRRGVDVEEADGLEDLGDIFSVEWTGGTYDYWFQGGYTRFGPDTDPSTNSSGGGITGKTIAVNDSAGVDMRVVISGRRARPGWPVYASPSPNGETLNCADLDGDGQAEIISGAGHYVLALGSDGLGHDPIGEGGLVGISDSLLLPGVAVSTDFSAPHSGRTVIAAASGTRVFAWNRFGELLLVYPPEPEILIGTRFTAGPMALDSILIVGDSEGRVRGLRPGVVPELRWRTTTPGFAVTALAAGNVLGIGHESLAWGNEVGEVFVAAGDESRGYSLADGWPRTLHPSAAAIAWLLLIEASERGDGMVIALDRAGRLGRFIADATAARDWTRDLRSPPSGPPALGDIDGDGSLEIVVACLDGQIHIVDLNGTAERFWPRSVWSPDTWRTGALRGGAALIDIDGDACAEIVQGSDNGTIHVWNGSGEEQAGWPVAFGFGANSSPIVAPFAPAAGSGSSAETFQLLISDQAGFATLILTDWPARELRPGEMWRPDIESGRTRCYPSALIPASQTVSALIDGKSVRFTPNPVVGSQGWLRVRMGRPGTLRLRMRDTSGREVWERLYRPIAGTDGDRLEMDLSDLAPGLYVVQIIAESDGETERLLRKLAIVR